MTVSTNVIYYCAYQVYSIISPLCIFYIRQSYMCNDILFVFATNIMWEKRHERAWLLQQRPGLTGNFCSIKTPCYQNRNSYYKAVLWHVIQASIADGDGHGNILDLSKSVFMTRQGAHRLRDYAGLVKMRLIKHFLPYITASFLFVKNIHAFTSFCDFGHGVQDGFIY